MLGKVCNENNPKNAQKRYFQLRKRLFHHAKVALLIGESGSFVTTFSFFLTENKAFLQVYCMDMPNKC